MLTQVGNLETQLENSKTIILKLNNILKIVWYVTHITSINTMTILSVQWRILSHVCRYVLFTNYRYYKYDVHIIKIFTSALIIYAFGMDF